MRLDYYNIFPIWYRYIVTPMIMKGNHKMVMITNWLNILRNFLSYLAIVNHTPRN